MRISDRHIERPKPTTRKKGKKQHDKEYTDFVWGIINRVRSGYYKVTDINSVVEQDEDEKRNSF